MMTFIFPLKFAHISLPILNNSRQDFDKFLLFRSLFYIFKFILACLKLRPKAKI